MKSLFRVFLLFLGIFSSITTFSNEPNPPDWAGTGSVTVCDPADQGATQGALDAVFATNGGPEEVHQFDGEPHAFLFKPGNHDTIEAKVGYYTSIIGLGETPDDTTIQHVHQSEIKSGGHDRVTSTFWRSAENFTQGQGSITWAVSQATPLRNVKATELTLSKDGAFASGGFFANCTFSGTVNMETQQQWCFRNSTMNQTTLASFNLVAIGSEITASPINLSTRYTAIPTTPLIADKPYITIDPMGFYHLKIPQAKSFTQGVNDNSDALDVDFTQVYVAKATDTAAMINMKMSQGTHVVLSPGLYELEGPIVINQPDSVLLGIGFPILQAKEGNSCIEIGDVDNVRVAGVLLQTISPPENPSTYLLRWGTEGGNYPGNAQRPGVLSDCFTRVGGPTDSVNNPVSATTMIQINSGYVILDNIWAWRADHDVQGNVVNGNNPCDYGLVVNGDHVTAYGLAVEHTLKDMTLWNGDYGQTFFYQCEFPYDVTKDYGNAGYVSYRVGAGVTNHYAAGVGAYSFFRDHSVTVKNGFQIDAPTLANLDIRFQNVFTWCITGKGGITHPIQCVGSAVSAGPMNTSYQAMFPSQVNSSISTMKNRFFTHTEICDRMTIEGPIGDPNPDALTYKIFENGNLTTIIPPGGNRTIDLHNRSSSPRTYQVTSENDLGLTGFGNIQAN